MADHEALAQALFGSDPVAAEEALDALSKVPDAASVIQTILPLPNGRGRPQRLATSQRLARLGQRWGDSIVPHLKRCICEGDWDTQLSTSPFFGGLSGSVVAEEAAVSVLKEAGDFDAERTAIDALGWLGVYELAADIDRHARTGDWTHRGSEGFESLKGGEYVYDYAYGKLWFCAITAIARMAARSQVGSRIRRLLSLLDKAVCRQMALAPQVGPAGLELVRNIGVELNERHVDPLIEQWGSASDPKLRRLCISLLAAIAPVRAAGFLLDLAVARGTDVHTRIAASEALGELRSATVAQRLGRTLNDGSSDHSCLDGAAGSLYAVNGQWDTNPAFYESLLEKRTEAADQFRYALAVRGDGRCADRLVADLDATDSGTRWYAALSLARLLGPESKMHLRHRIDAADNDLERSAMLAAAIRAGDVDRVGELHLALQGVETLSKLRSLWRIEIIDAFRLAPDGNVFFEAWRREALISDRQLAYFEEWGRLPNVKHQVMASAVQAAPEPVGPKSETPKVFISYSHRDKAWLRRFQEMQSPLQRSGQLELWDDSRILPGKWRPQIDQAMRGADAALFLVSSHFLASDFVNNAELPDLLRLADERGLRIVWVLLDDCFWDKTALSTYQGVNAGRPLTALRKAERQSVIKAAWLKVLGE